MLHDIKNIFHFIIVFQCVLFSFYLISQKKEKQLSILLLITFLMITAINQGGGIIFHFKELRLLVNQSAPYLYIILYPFYFASIPVLFLYVQSLTKNGFYFKKIYLLHFIPSLYLIFLTAVKIITGNTESLRNDAINNIFFSIRQDQIYSDLQYVQFIVYIIASIILIRQYRTKIKNIFSGISQINLSWLSFVIYGLIAWKMIHIAETILWVATGYKYPYLLMSFYILAEIAFITFISLLFIKCTRQPAIFWRTNGDNPKGRYEKSGLPETTIEIYKKKLISYMEISKPFLNPDLTLNDLAEKLGISSNHLSQILNSHFNQNFYDFINSFRIEESKKLLRTENGENKMTILEILYASGFNSKSVFNTAFKKITGRTPSQFRNEHISVNN